MASDSAKDSKSANDAKKDGRPGFARRLLYWTILAQLVSELAFIGILIAGERSRTTLIALYLPRLPLLLGAIFGAIALRWTRLPKRIIRGLLVAEILLALAVLFPVMGFRLGSSKTSAHPIKLASYNVFWGNMGRPRLIAEVAEMDADIVVCQAAFSSLHERLKEKLPDRIFAQEGELMMMSKFPITKMDVPPPLADGTSAMFTKFIVDTPQGALRVYVVHPFSPRHALFADEETLANIRHREEQITAAVTAAENDSRPAFGGSATTGDQSRVVPPFILVGDTNLPPMSSIGDAQFAHLHDAFDDVGFGFGYSFPSKRPWMRIDRALGSDRVHFLDVHAGPHGFSDHRPLFASFEIAE